MALTGRRIMIVEDEALISMMIETYLTDLGCEVVTTASRLDDAVDKAAKVAIDVAMLDVNLDGRLSYPVAEILQSRNIPFVFATGYGVICLPSALQGLPVLPKPFNLDQLASALLIAMSA